MRLKKDRKKISHQLPDKDLLICFLFLRVANLFPVPR